MKIIKNIVAIISSQHTVAQKINHIKYLLSPKAEILGYDPITLSIVATSRCTLSCDMCPTHSGRVPREYEHLQRTKNDMGFDLFKNILDRFYKATTVQIIGSGEPLLNPDLFKMIDYAAQKRMVVKTFSNGTTIDNFIDQILSSKLEGITISLNGHSAEEFHRMTGMGEETYIKIRKSTKKLIEEKKRRHSNVRIKLSFIIDRNNYTMIPDMINAALELGADHTFFCTFLTAPFPGLTRDERLLVPSKKVIDEISSYFKALPVKSRKLFSPPRLVDPDHKKNNCSAHFSQIRFDGDGSVSCCSMMLLDMSGHGTYLDEGVWNNNFFTEMRRRFLSGDGSMIPDPCKVCPDNKGV